MPSGVDYDEVAAGYHARYAHHDYAEVETALHRLAEGATSILEVGCGTGHWLERLARPGRRLVGIDPSVGMLTQRPESRDRGSVVQAVAEAIPFADGTFDFVFAVNAIHHFTDYRRFVTEAARVLSPGGRVATVALDPSVGTDSWYIYDYFPRSLELDLERYPPGAGIRQAMADRGLAAVTTEVAQHMPASVPAREYLEGPAFHRHATSQLSLLEDLEFEEGLARIWADVQEAEADSRVHVLSADLRLWVTHGRRPVAPHEPGSRAD